ncbi:hypothetical protein CLERM_479 [Coxiella-like endosymbiont]|nr:hypothetical protein CLERM_479 [Coxiella-like endosymbiont]
MTNPPAVLGNLKSLLDDEKTTLNKNIASHLPENSKKLNP